MSSSGLETVIAPTISPADPSLNPLRQIAKQLEAEQAAAKAAPQPPVAQNAATPAEVKPEVSIWDEEEIAAPVAPAQTVEADEEEVVSPTSGKKVSKYQQMRAEIQALRSQLQAPQQTQQNSVDPQIQALIDQNRALMALLQPQPSEGDRNLAAAYQQLKPHLISDLDPVNQRVAQIEKLLQQEAAQKEAALERHQTRQLRQTFESETNAALSTSIYDGHENVKPQNRELIAHAITMLAMARDVPPAEIAKQMRGALREWGQGFEMSKRKQAELKRGAAAQNIPQPIPGGNTRVEEGVKFPSMDELRADKRFASVTHWMSAGSPPLRK